MEGSGVTNGPLSAPSNSVSSTTGPPLSPDQPEAQQQSSLTELIQMWIQFGKTFAIIFPIYVLGYFAFSFSWVLIGLAALFYWRKNHGNKDYRVNRAIAFLEHEEKAVKQSVPTTDLPPWVSLVFPIMSWLLFLTCLFPPPSFLRLQILPCQICQHWLFFCWLADRGVKMFFFFFRLTFLWNGKESHSAYMWRQMLKCIWWKEIT